MEFKRGNSWKNKLRISIDKAIEKSKTYDEFLKNMEIFGYEIKVGKYLSFRHKDKKDKGGFVRAKASTLGEDYIKERIKERITSQNKKYLSIKIILIKKMLNKNIGTIVDTKNNQKVKSSKGYEIWTQKHNMETIASTLNELRKYS